MIGNKIEVMRQCEVDYSITNNKIEVKLNNYMVFYSSSKSLNIFKKAEKLTCELKTSFRNALYISLYDNLFGQ